MSTYIAELGEDSFQHSFGGTSWTFCVPDNSSPNPTLLMTLDSRDTRIGLEALRCDLPLCARFDREYPSRQEYTFDPASHIADFQGASWQVASAEVAFPNILPLRSLRLRSLSTAEDPAQSSEESAIATFLGGKGVFRIGGEPLWIYFPEVVHCSCGKVATHVASIGHESYYKHSGIVAEDEPFFIGESALYFFVCVPCRRVFVLAQPT